MTEKRTTMDELENTLQMKAAVMRGFGDFDVLRFEEVEIPRPGPGEVLVKILAAGVNRLDHYLREGSLTRDIPLPQIPGSDASGEVAALGDKVSGFEIGERVVPVAGFRRKRRITRSTRLAGHPAFNFRASGFPVPMPNTSWYRLAFSSKTRPDSPLARWRRYP